MAAMIGARFFARRRLVGLTVTRDRTSDTRSLWLAGLHRLDGLHRLHIRSRAAFCTYLPALTAPSSLTVTTVTTVT